MIEYKIYNEYNIIIYNLNNIINKIAELDIFKYFNNNKIDINFKSRDVKRLITHFLINSIIKVIKNSGNEKIIFNYKFINLQILDIQYNHDIDILINKIFKKFKFCHFNFDDIFNLSSFELTDIKRNLQRCHLAISKINNIKKFLDVNGLTNLHKTISTDHNIKMSLTK
jgi:hypothetical protein